jgi:hypothetical protein
LVPRYGRNPNLTPQEPTFSSHRADIDFRNTGWQPGGLIV